MEFRRIIIKRNNMRILVRASESNWPQSIIDITGLTSVDMGKRQERKGDVEY